MIDLMPKSLICKNYINQWKQYSHNIEDSSYIYIKKYLLDSFKRWVENCDNPLAIPWVADLFENDLGSKENNFKELEKSLEENNFKSLFEELTNNKTKNPHEISKKIESLKGEIFAFYELKKKYGSVKKISQIGDWLCDENIIVSVKTKFVSDYNYQLIENTIKSLFFIKENTVLRKYNHITLENLKEIDNNFRNKITCFLNSEFADLVCFFDCNLGGWSNFCLKGTRYFVENNNKTSYLELHADSYTEDLKNYINILLKEDRSGKNNPESQISINLEEHENKEHNNIIYDTNSFFSKNKFPLELLKIDIFLDKLDIGYSNAIKQGKNFIGWINIIVHEAYKKDILENMEELEKKIKKILSKKKYKIIIVFKFQWDFDKQKNIILEFQ